MLRTILIAAAALGIAVFGGLWWLFLADSKAPEAAPGLFSIGDWRSRLPDDPSALPTEIRVLEIGRDKAPGFAAREFWHIRVFFLRHDARAGSEAVGDLYEAEVLAHPNDELFAQATDVQHAQRGRRCELNGEVAVADRVQTVLTNLRRAVRVDHAQRAGDAFAV